MRKRLIWLFAALPALGACSTLTPTLTSEGALKAFKPIKYTDFCSAQRGIAEHNSRYDSIKKGKPVTYKAPCDQKKPTS